MRLFIVRHGETIENQKHIIQGQLRGTLSELGILEAEKLSERLKSENFDLAFASSADRAKNTAEIILKNHSGLKLGFDDNLLERAYGEFTGMTHEERDALYPGVPKEEIYKGTGVETLQSVYDRAKDFYDQVLKKYLDSDLTILIVAHRYINTELFRVLEGKDCLLDIDKSYKNASLTVYSVNKDGCELELFNDVSHLE